MWPSEISYLVIKYQGLAEMPDDVLQNMVEGFTERGECEALANWCATYVGACDKNFDAVKYCLLRKINNDLEKFFKKYSSSLMRTHIYLNSYSVFSKEISAQEYGEEKGVWKEKRGLERELTHMYVTLYSLLGIRIQPQDLEIKQSFESGSYDVRIDPLSGSPWWDNQIEPIDKMDNFKKLPFVHDDGSPPLISRYTMKPVEDIELRRSSKKPA